MEKRQISISMLEAYMFGVMFTFGVATTLLFLFLLNLFFFGAVILPILENMFGLMTK